MPKGPYRLVSVNKVPARAKLILGRVIDTLSETYTVEHVANCETINEVEPILLELKPDMLFIASMWTESESSRIQTIASSTIPAIKIHIIPHGLQISQGPEGVVAYLVEEMPRIVDGKGGEVEQSFAGSVRQWSTTVALFPGFIKDSQK